MLKIIASIERIEMRLNIGAVCMRAARRIYGFTGNEPIALKNSMAAADRAKIGQKRRRAVRAAAEDAARLRVDVIVLSAYHLASPAVRGRSRMPTCVGYHEGCADGDNSMDDRRVSMLR